MLYKLYIKCVQGLVIIWRSLSIISWDLLSLSYRRNVSLLIFVLLFESFGCHLITGAFLAHLGSFKVL